MNKLFRNPEFFDNFGVLAFLIIIIFSIYALLSGILYTWMIWVLLVIGILGLIVDVNFVAKFWMGTR